MALRLTGNALYQFIDEGGGGYHSWSHDAAELMRLDDTGLGIGGTPLYLFDVIEASGDANMALRATDGLSTSDTFLRNSVSHPDARNFIYFGDDTDSDAGRIYYDHGEDDLTFTIATVDALTLNSSGLGINVGGFSGAAGIPGYPLDIWSGSVSVVIGGDSGASTRTNSTDKYFRLGAPHYTNAEEPSGVLMGVNSSTDNHIYVGGGTSNFNAATEVRFYNASDNTTLTGTHRATFDDEGLKILAGTLKIQEQAAAEADSTGYGQLWVETATPNHLNFTNDAGDDIPIDKGVIKAYVFGTSAASLTASFNIASGTDEGTGAYQYDFTNNMSAADEYATATDADTSSARMSNTNSHLAGSYDIDITQYSDGGHVDLAHLSMVSGDLA